MHTISCCFSSVPAGTQAIFIGRKRQLIHKESWSSTYMQGEPYLHQAMGSSYHLAKDEFAPSRPVCFNRLIQLRRGFCRPGCTFDGVFCRQEQPRDKYALSATCHPDLTGEPRRPREPCKLYSCPCCFRSWLFRREGIHVLCKLIDLRCIRSVIAK